MKKEKHIPNSVEIIHEHLDRFFDSEEIFVLHEKESDTIHADIIIVKPNEKRNFTILLTCGLSALPMKVPADLDNLKFAEITMLLPIDWKLNLEDFENEDNYWPIRTLKQLLKYPHLNDTWLGARHTIPLDKTHEVNHQFDSLILLESIELSEDFTYIKTDEKDIYLYAAIPLYKEELEYQQKHGTDKLFELFNQFGVEEVIDINRKNVSIVNQ